MSPKRVAVLMLLMVGAPLWVTLRSRLGEWMLAALLGVWCLGWLRSGYEWHGHRVAVPGGTRPVDERVPR